MTLLRIPSSKRGYLLGCLAGLITCFGATIAGKLLVTLGLHADLTYLDDGLLGVLVALLVLVLHRHYDSERSLHQARIAGLISVHRAIVADLETIAAITGNTALAEIATDAAAKIHATIVDLPSAQEILEQSPLPKPVTRPQRKLA